jgi:hypothetical protein
MTDSDIEQTIEIFEKKKNFDSEDVLFLLSMKKIITEQSERLLKFFALDDNGDAARENYRFVLNMRDPTFETIEEFQSRFNTAFKSLNAVKEHIYGLYRQAGRLDRIEKFGERVDLMLTSEAAVGVSYD